MSPGDWLLFWVVGLGVVAVAIGRHPMAFIAGAISGLAIWLVCGLFWVVGTAVDCSEARTSNGYYGDIPEECQ